ncbi:hypothetical protein J5N97_015230 [Dioscorea zingiberensis]|uniref:Uncharacterized protein n=1 Tax=Dioscorea zingiberensis TaxID=325984 RepID=A0A9D5HKG4_9LILI|nr:hypothetical protein J5N97_015230 [Dioscorea zingiberensis]
MASGICSVFTKPLFLPYHCEATKESRVCIRGIRGLSCQVASSKAMKFLQCHNLNFNMAIRSKPQDIPPVSCNHLCVSVTGFSGVISGRHMKIVGYWMGPDIEDGCGYVEATVIDCRDEL